MGNSWFQFRQFTVHQKKAAMKVTTDGCLFGALQPPFPEGGKGKIILDIGTGTGLLSLMTAQLNPFASITALEIEPGAAREAADNISGSPFKDCVQVVLQDVLVYKPAGRFHLIICNPPFHESQLSSPDKNRNMAHHSATLQLGQIFQLAVSWLDKDGVLSLLLPFYREEEARQLGIPQGLLCKKIIRVRQTQKHDFFRTVLFFGKEKAPFQMEEITIRLDNNTYSPEFKALLKPFYLNL